MSNQLKRVTIDRYLDDLCAELQMMPDEDVAEIRREMREHLTSYVEELVANGVDGEDAVSAAIRKFGSAHMISREILSKPPYSWMWHEKDGRFAFSVNHEGITKLIGLLPPVYFLVESHLFGIPSPNWWLPIAYWLAPLLLATSLIEGCLTAMDAIIEQAGTRGSFDMSRLAVQAVRDQQSTQYNRLQRALDLHRILPLVYVALRRVQQPRTSRNWWRYPVTLIPFVAVMMSFHTIHSNPFVGYLLLTTTTIFGEGFGELATVLYYRRRQRLMMREGGVDA